MDRIVGELDELALPYTIDISVFGQPGHDGLRDHIERVGVKFYARYSCG